MKKILLAVIMLFMLTSCFNTVNLSENNIEKVINKMSVEEKVGQLFFVHCDDKNMDAILSKNPGGILMFGGDFKNLSREDVKLKIQSYKDRSKYPLIIGVDEEGGTVTRVSANPLLHHEDFRSPKAYYEAGGMELVTEKERDKANLLSSLGINLNLAPVADLSNNSEDFIFKRSFSADPYLTSEFVKNSVSIMKEFSVGSCIKHFPGYGKNADTHTGIATDTRELEELRNADFIPFISGIEAGADCILVSHNIMENIDNSPASLSPTIHKILRDELKFNGLIITDDMNMDAVKAYGDIYKTAVLAGNDLIIVSDFESAYNEVLNAVNDGTISMDIIDSAILRIMKFKAKVKD